MRQNGSRATDEQSLVTDCLTLVDQYIGSLRQEYSANTVNNRMYILLPIFRELGITDVTQITLYDLDVYIDKHMNNDKPTTISTKKQVLRSFFQYCQEYREINLAFHWAAIRRKKVRAPRKKTFTRAEVMEVIEGAKHVQDRLMIGLLFFTGIRISELIGLQREHLYGTQIRIRGKGSYDRVVHIPRWLHDELTLYLSLRPDALYVFSPLQKHKTHPSDRYISAYSVRERIQREFKRTLDREMHPHQLRHSFAVDWLMRGGDLRSLQVMLGHDSIETTQIYLGLTDTQTGDIYSRVFA
jgi:integrase/recombinase XerD